MKTSPTFDIFSGASQRDAVWVCAVEGLTNAKGRMEQLASAKPGSYFVVKLATQEIVAGTETLAKPLRVILPHPQLEISIVILRKIGYRVGEACNFEGEPLVAVDGDLRTIDDVFHMVETYNRKHG